MNTIINFKTEKKVKTDAQKIAKKMGLNLSDILNVYLRVFIMEKRLSIDVEEPSDYLLKQVVQAEKDRKAGLVSPDFTSAKEAISWLKNKNAKYNSELRPRKSQKVNNKSK
jgi:addiction module RelB/DinJ family antitoxin